MPTMSGTSVERSEMTPVARLDWATNERMPRASSPSGRCSAAGNRRSAETPATEMTTLAIACATTMARSTAVTPLERERDDREEPQAGGARLVHPAQVVAAVQQQRRRADVLGRLHEREQRGRDDRAADALLAEEVVREGREGDQDHGRERASEELEYEHLPEEPPQPAPILARDVAEPVLRQRLLDGQVEQHLEEADGRHRGREHAERREPEDARRNDRPEDAEADGRVDPDSRERPSPKGPGGHRGSV